MSSPRSTEYNIMFAIEKVICKRSALDSSKHVYGERDDLYKRDTTSLARILRAGPAPSLSIPTLRPCRLDLIVYCRSE